MDFNNLPNELVKMVISFLDKKDAKQFALTSKKMHQLTLDRLWSKPVYQKLKSLLFLKRISRFPIKELRVGDFKCKAEEIIEKITSLKRLYLNLGSECVYVAPSEIKRLNLPVVVHSKTLKICSKSDFDLLLDTLETGLIKELIIDYHHSRTLRLSPELLKMLVSKVYISEISVNALRFTSENVEQFCQIFSSMKNCQILFPPVWFEQNDEYFGGESESEGDWSDDSEASFDGGVGGGFNGGHNGGNGGDSSWEDDHDFTIPWKDFHAYKFTIKDIETFARYNIKISFISSSVLRDQGEYSKLMKFVPVLRRLKHLKCFEFEEYGFKFDHSGFVKFSNLPFRNIKTHSLNMSKENVGNFVDTLSKMKSLQHIHIVWNGFKLSPEEFALFKDLPVKKVNLTALDLTRQNVPKFREIMNEMKIEKIVSSLTKKKKWGLGIRFSQFGPSGIYCSV